MKTGMSLDEKKMDMGYNGGSSLAGVTGKLDRFFDKKIWRIIDVAEYLQCSVKTIYNKTSRGEIPHIKKGKTLYFRPDVIESWVLEGNLE